MSDEQLQQDIRRFLKTFGVSAHREIEALLREAVATGTLSAGQLVRVRARLELLDREFVVEDEIRAG
jgi:hypothetical protein